MYLQASIVTVGLVVHASVNRLKSCTAALVAQVPSTSYAARRAGGDGHPVCCWEVVIVFAIFCFVSLTDEVNREHGAAVVAVVAHYGREAVGTVLGMGHDASSGGLVAWEEFGETVWVWFSR